MLIDEAQRLTARMAVPPGSLGLLEKQVQRLFRAWPKIEWELRPHHFVFAADNGIVAAGVVGQD